MWNENENENMSSPSMTTSSGSTPISLQNCSIASGPSTSGSSAVVYCLNQLRQRLLLNPSSTLFVRLELNMSNRTNIKEYLFINQIMGNTILVVVVVVVVVITVVVFVVVVLLSFHLNETHFSSSSMQQIQYFNL